MWLFCEAACGSSDFDWLVLCTVGGCEGNGASRLAVLSCAAVRALAIFDWLFLETRGFDWSFFAAMWGKVLLDWPDTVR